MDLSRVVEINWEGGYGSGYLIAPGVVLTARHVLQETDEILPELGLPCRVRAVGARGAVHIEWDEAELKWFHSTLDIAVLHTDTRDRSHKLPRFAKLVQKVAKIACQAVGFPRAASTKGMDDTYQLDGVIGAASYVRSDDLSVQVSSPAPENPENWPGVSGAALFAGDRLIGVVRSYPQEFGGRVLKATSLTTLANDPEFCAALSTPCPLLMDEVDGNGAGSVEPGLNRMLQLALLQDLIRAFVDLVRLNFVYVSPDAPDAARSSEFMEISQLSRSDVRSQIETLSPSLSPTQITKVREIERSMNYISRNFFSINSMKERGFVNERKAVHYESFIFLRDRENWKSLRKLSEQVENFITTNKTLLDVEFLEAIQNIIEQFKLKSLPKTIKDNLFYQIRWRSQDILQAELNLSYVLLDRAERTNTAYCLLDFELLRRLEE